MQLKNNMNKEEVKDAVIIGCFIIIILGITSFVGTFFYGIYHLLDKLIDKIWHYANLLKT